jgi:hypothetical protein
MKEVVIQIPTLEAEQNIDIDVKINGRKKSLKYRVEIVDYESEDSTNDDRIEILKHIVKDHEKDWELIQIGAPLQNNIPIMFRKRNS